MKVRDYVPVVDWLPGYETSYFRPDLIASVTILSQMTLKRLLVSAKERRDQISTEDDPSEGA